MRVHSSVTHWLATTASESLTSPPLPFPSLPSPSRTTPGWRRQPAYTMQRPLAGGCHALARSISTSISLPNSSCPRPLPQALPSVPTLVTFATFKFATFATLACATRVPHALPHPSLPLPSSLTTTCVRRSPSLSSSQDRASDGASGELHSPAARDPGSVDVSPPCPPPGPQAAKRVRTRAFVRRRHAHKKRQRQRRRQRAR